jgi:hypothetical protein
MLQLAPHHSAQQENGTLFEHLIIAALRQRLAGSGRACSRQARAIPSCGHRMPGATLGPRAAPGTAEKRHTPRAPYPVRTTPSGSPFGFNIHNRQSNFPSTLLRFQAQAERLYRRAVEDFHRLPQLRGQLPPEKYEEANELILEPVPAPRPVENTAVPPSSQPIEDPENEPNPEPPPAPVTAPRPEPPTAPPGSTIRLAAAATQRKRVPTPNGSLLRRAETKP